MNFLRKRFLTLASAALLAVTVAACDDDPVDVDPLVAPTGLTATSPTPTSTLVTWSQVDGATSYELDRATGAGALATIQASLTATAFNDSGLTPSTTYRYVVRAVRGTEKSASSAEVSVTTGAVGPKVATLTGVPTSRTLYADTVYTLSGYVKVSNNATLTIQPGTRIVGDSAVAGSSLWILRGSKIMAQGTAAAPIVFTSARAVGNRSPGDWGGIIIIGRALINRTGTQIFTEGPVGAAENYAGGTDAADNSGVLKYVRVEYAGYDVSNGSGQELNSISMYAVGSGTQLDYVQTVSGLDDSFEWWGGGADVGHLFSFESGDDHFDWTEGFRGRGQFMVALQTDVVVPRPGTGTTSSDPRGMEGDGCDPAISGCVTSQMPFSMPTFANFTLVGPGTGVFSTSDGNGMVLRRGTGGFFVNGIVARWPGTSISVRDAQTNVLFTADSLYFRNLVVAGNGANFEAVGANFGSKLNDNKTAWSVTELGLDATFQGTLPTKTTTVTAATVNITPVAGSAAATGGLTSFAGTPFAGRTASYLGGTLSGTSYRGAAPADGTRWWDGWTSFERK